MRWEKEVLSLCGCWFSPVVDAYYYSCPSIHPPVRPCNGVEWRRPYSWNVGVHMFHDTSDRANSAPYNTFRTIWQT